jgi:hypothetical protein
MGKYSGLAEVAKFGDSNSGPEISELMSDVECTCAVTGLEGDDGVTLEVAVLDDECCCRSFALFWACA